MSKNIGKSGISPGGKGNGLWLVSKRLLQPRSMMFSLALVYFLSQFINAIQKKENPFVLNQWIFVSDLMMGPLLVLITAILILLRRLSTTAFAIVIAGYLFYVTGYRGMISIPNSHGVPILSLDAVNIWFKAMPSALVLQAMFATAAFIFGTGQVVHLLRERHKRLP